MCAPVRGRDWLCGATARNSPDALGLKDAIAIRLMSKTTRTRNHANLCCTAAGRKRALWEYSGRSKYRRCHRRREGTHGGWHQLWRFAASACSDPGTRCPLSNVCAQPSANQSGGQGAWTKDRGACAADGAQERRTPTPAPHLLPSLANQGRALAVLSLRRCSSAFSSTASRSLETVLGRPLLAFPLPPGPGVSGHSTPSAPPSALFRAEVSIDSD